MPQDDPRGWTELDEAGLEKAADEIWTSRPEGPFGVFAYGSLLWNPGFEFERRLRGLARGWHREFCIEISGFRGTPEQPGLMLALMPGGSCVGQMLIPPAGHERATILAMVKRETPYVELLGNHRWLRLQTAEGPMHALTFYASPSGERLRRGLTIQQTAHVMARACGYAGSCAQYLHNTVTALESAGIHDKHLWQLQRLVACEIDSLHG